MADISSAIAVNVRAERARRRWRQADLAERIGWSTGQVCQLEKGTRAVHANDLPLLCRAFRMTLAELSVHAEPADLEALLVGPDRQASDGDGDSDSEGDGGDR